MIHHVVGLPRFAGHVSHNVDDHYDSQIYKKAMSGFEKKVKDKLPDNVRIFLDIRRRGGNTWGGRPTPNKASITIVDGNNNPVATKEVQRPYATRLDKAFNFLVGLATFTDLNDDSYLSGRAYNHLYYNLGGFARFLNTTYAEANKLVAAQAKKATAKK